MNLKSSFVLATLLLGLAVACSSSDSSTNGSCGEKPVGSTCKKAAGDCEGLVCTNGTWGCPAGETEVAVTPGNCSAVVDGGSCGAKPIGSTCKKPAGDCESLVCTGSTWGCPAGDTEVPVAPGSCVTPDGG